MFRRRPRVFLATVSAVMWLVPAVVAAQQATRCALVCAPELKIEPTFTVENLGRRHRVEVDGHVERVERETVFELIFALDVPTEIPRVGFTLEAIFAPFGETSVNPITGAAAGEPGGHEIRDNNVGIETELNIHLLDEVQTGGWVSSHFDIVDQLSAAEQPEAGSVYTHKLDFELDTAFHVFNWLSEGNWLRNVETEISIDYLATGLPKAGDVIRDERFLDRASPWSLSFVFVLPLAPLAP